MINWTTSQAYSSTSSIVSSLPSTFVAVPNLGVPPPLFSGFPNRPPLQTPHIASQQRPPPLLGNRPFSTQNIRSSVPRPAFTGAQAPLIGAPPLMPGNRPRLTGRPPLPLIRNQVPMPGIAPAPSNNQAFSSTSLPQEAPLVPLLHNTFSSTLPNVNNQTPAAPNVNAATSTMSTFSHNIISMPMVSQSSYQQAYPANFASSVSSTMAPPVLPGSRPPPWQTYQAPPTVPVISQQPNLQYTGVPVQSSMESVGYQDESVEQKLDCNKLDPDFKDAKEARYDLRADTSENNFNRDLATDKHTYDPERPGFERGDKRRYSYDEDDRYKRSRSSYGDQGDRYEDIPHRNRETYRESRSKSPFKEARDITLHESDAYRKDLYSEDRYNYDYGGYDENDRSMESSNRHSHDHPLNQNQVEDLVKRYNDRTDDYSGVDDRDSFNEEFIPEKRHRHDDYVRRHERRSDSRERSEREYSRRNDKDYRLGYSRRDRDRSHSSEKTRGDSRSARIGDQSFDRERAYEPSRDNTSDRFNYSERSNYHDTEESRYVYVDKDARYERSSEDRGRGYDGGKREYTDRISYRRTENRQRKRVVVSNNLFFEQSLFIMTADRTCFIDTNVTFFANNISIDVQDVCLV